MTVYPIGAASVVVYLTLDDLRPYHVDPTELTPDLACSLAGTACQRAGFVWRGREEIDAFSSCCGVMVFVRFRSEDPIWFVFDEVEDVLAVAVALRRAPPESALWWWRGKYWLSLSGASPDSAAVCSEFGFRPPEDPFRVQRLSKTGRLIFQRDAIFQLFCQFSGLHF